MQLLGPQENLQFSPVAQARSRQAPPQWTADLMAGNSYIFIFLPTGDCLAATGSARRPKLAAPALRPESAQRWRRTSAACW